jgi:DNA polymerase III subunit delta'
VPFSQILGQDEAIRTLVRALESGRIHHAYRFEGPDGVGKEMAALALAQALVCTAGDKLGCGRCDACRRAITFTTERPEVPLHPDVIMVERGLYPGAIIGKDRDEIAQISVEQIRKIVLSHVAYAPHEGRGRLFIIRRAEELAGTSNASAANALLKYLEEPRQGTHFVLLTSRPDRMLDTIRSRTQKVRFGPLSDPILQGILTAKGIAPEKHESVIDLAAGSASAALGLVDAERTTSRDEFVAAMMSAMRASTLGPAVNIAEALDTKDKDRLKEDLRALGANLARSAKKRLETEPIGATIDARRFESVLRAIGYLERNASPSLSIVALVMELRAAVP